MNDESALLTAIIADPTDDTVRLVYADFLEERGDVERAEFIRVQIARALLPAKDVESSQPESLPGHGILCTHRLVCGGPDCRLLLGDAIHLSGCRWNELREQERELWNEYRLNGAPHPWVGTMGYRIRANWLSSHNDPVITIPRSNGEKTIFRLHRGFVHEVICTTADWLKNAKGILVNPIRKVTLTTLPEVNYTKCGCRLQGWDTPFFTGKEMADGLVKLMRINPFRLTDDFVLLHLCFPGISFELQGNRSGFG